MKQVWVAHRKLSKSPYIALALAFIIGHPVYGKIAASGWEEDDVETAPYKLIEEGTPNTAEGSEVLQENRQNLIPLIPAIDSSSPDKPEVIPSELSVKDSSKVNSSRGKQPEQNNTANWFFNPEPIPWLDSLTLKTKKSARKAARVPGKIIQQTADIASDPHFRNTALTVAAAGGAGVGLYFLLKNRRNNNGASNFIQWVDPYVTKNGVHVPGYWRTIQDPSLYNNFSTTGNINPYTGKSGYIVPAP